MRKVPIVRRIPIPVPAKPEVPKTRSIVYIERDSNRRNRSSSEDLEVDSDYGYKHYYARDFGNIPQE